MESWSLEISLVTQRFREDSEVVWGPRGCGGAGRFSIRSWDHIRDPEVLLDHEALFGTQRSWGNPEALL
ncbi:hypothetical protein F2Q70_00038576 [Brassica cretica]|uniref:Uncharacterized protein n=1 Tax=Brassica cretica TaxID=69181 RepID=A0A8S9KB20_BRACR|nr:hypothetical protein F2Q70_00038576 [Brassica cretica]